MSEILQLIEKLKARVAERREYKLIPGSNCADLDQVYSNMQTKNYDPNRMECIYNTDDQTVVFSDMCIPGPGQQGSLGLKWRLPLPDDYLTFCNSFGEYVFAGRCPLHLEDAAWLEDMGGIRDAYDIPANTPRRLFYFAAIVSEPGYFVFRWSEDYKKMDVVIVEDYGDVGEPDLLGPDGDQYVTDQSFTAWLSRMIETDGYPLIPGADDPRRGGLVRI